MKELLSQISLFLIITFSYACANDIRYNQPLDSVQFKATHNSYKLPDLPNVQIDKYDVWEIELDFGYCERYHGFVVGHSKPEPRSGLFSLEEWVQNVMSVESSREHPIILKLEAKTDNPARISHSSERFERGTFWPIGWQEMLIDSLTQWIGEERLVTPERFSTEFNSKWPIVQALAGIVIVTLQDNNDNYYVTRLSDQLFIDSIPGLTAWWPPVKDSSEFENAIESGANRITLDNVHVHSWTSLIDFR